MIKVFTLNKNNKIELTKEELQKLLDESYWDGYRANNHCWTYTSPSGWGPYYSTTYTVTTSSQNNDGTVTITNTNNENFNTITTAGVKNGTI